MSRIARFPSLLPLIVAAGLLLPACKQETDQPKEVVDAAQDEALASSETEEMYNLADDVAAELNATTFGKSATDTVESALVPPCATVMLDSVDTAGGAHYYRYTIDFGSENCLCRDGIYRRGRIMVERHGRYRREGATTRVRFDDYVADDVYAVSGERLTTSQGRNAAGHYVHTVEVRDARFEALETGRVLTWNASRRRELIEGGDNADPLDNVYRITGGASGNGFSGNDFTTEIETPLLYRLSCIDNRSARHPVSGRTIVRSGGNIITIEYDPNGDAACDRLATIQFNDRPPRTRSLR